MCAFFPNPDHVYSLKAFSILCLMQTFGFYGCKGAFDLVLALQKVFSLEELKSDDMC